ncbi:MAG: alkaline phosphatase family protein [Candidatus Paceibacterota bacterium]
MKRIIILTVIVVVAILGFFYFYEQAPAKATKLYWFIPDGVRAEPDIFTIYKWAEEGKLPNIKKLMEQGAYGYSIPDFPSHTPTNFASLFTGAHPIVHGVADGPMHTEGAPLAKPSVKGFASTAKKVDPIWTILENIGKKVALLSIPGSTPPELKQGITIRGRWGGWGADTPAIVFEPKEKLAERKEAGKAFRLFYLGQKLTQFIDKSSAFGWQDAPESFSQAYEIKMENYGLLIYAYIFDSTDDNTQNYDSVRFSLDKESELVTLGPGVWSDWKDVVLKWKEQEFDSNVKIKVIKLWDSGNFRIRFFFNNINKFITEPSEVAAEITENIGPMVDFVDNWPAQLIYEDEDKDTFFEEVKDSLAWHKKAAGFIMKKYSPDVFIQDVYTPNQMLEARWWHRNVDKNRPDYDEKRAKDAWDDILVMYQGLDAIIGEAMKNADKETLIVFSSDHGVIPLYKQVRLNNLFAKKGWLKFTINEETGEPAINWEKTKVVFLKMVSVYINPNGLAGDWTRGSGPEYEVLRDEVAKAISELEDDNGIKPLVQAIKWENAPKYFELPTDRVGDLVLETTPGYQWWEEVTKDMEIFTIPLGSGYKQAVNAKTTKGMWTPFIIVGPGVKAGVQLKEPISHIDQMPTILNLLDVEIPNYVQGSVLSEILE